MLPLSFGESFLEAEQIQRRVSGEQESLCENSLGFGHLIPFNLEKYVRYPTQVVLDFPQANSACCRQVQQEFGSVLIQIPLVYDSTVASNLPLNSLQFVRRNAGTISLCLDD